MTEKLNKRDVLAGSLSREPGSPESRAAARRIIEDPQRMPVVVSQYVRVGAHDEDRCPVGPPVVCDSATASVTPCNGETIILVRDGAESLADFEKRCCDSLPVRTGGVVTMNGDACE